MNEVVIIQKKNLRKFGYTLDAKVGQKEKFLLYFWLPSITYHENSTIKKKSSPKFDINLQNFQNLKKRKEKKNRP